jgi:hypothetical protein
VLDELACCDIVGKSGVVMLEGVDVKLVDSSDELLFESSVNVVVLWPELK